ncbi:glycosyltransferase family 4 protein [Corynebacterium tapiri]|uniref:Glycosyltransferase family 1 protein n=1 Tax=Corynebacterium tapiri TaxID=1448266 RepID=A0A5C4U461_9CORY|nr:glycosyltransferase family 1 protein [Corynebacterium tapiri]TNL97272.1 glycosyltransferase family 1 protein [Corynebacterium tapiri]
MRVAIVAESFLPNINGVTNSVLRVLEHLKEHGHDAVVIAPGARDFQEEIPDYLGFPIRRVPTVRVPLIDSLPIGVPNSIVAETLHEFRPDVVHLASPFVLGASGAFAARQLRIPAVALYQTDVAGFASKYHLTPLATAAWDWTRTIHNQCQLTLAPSSLTIAQLERHGINNVHHWGRGVDTVRFDPAKRDDALRRSWDPTGKKKIVGFVGRLAPEKGVHRLASLGGRDDIQLVIVGDGPSRGELASRIPSAVFTGALGGDDLARAYASLDLFVHAGEFETFCQAIQEAQASGVPTIGPRAGGPVDLVQDGVNGLLLDVDTFSVDLPAAAEWLLDDSRLDQLKRQARQSVANKTWSALGDQLLSYYATAIEREKSTSRGPFGLRLELPEWATRGLGGRVA